MWARTKYGEWFHYYEWHPEPTKAASGWMLSLCGLIKHRNRVVETGPAQMCQKCWNRRTQTVNEGQS